MLKKLAIALAASAFALTLAAPLASACPGKEKHKQETAEKKDTKDTKDTKVAKKETAKSDKQQPKKVAKKDAK